MYRFVCPYTCMICMMFKRYYIDPPQHSDIGPIEPYFAPSIPISPYIYYGGITGVHGLPIEALHQPRQQKHMIENQMGQRA